MNYYNFIYELYMNFQKFIYDFLKFNDISANFHDISACAEALKSDTMGV